MDLSRSTGHIIPWYESIPVGNGLVPGGRVMVATRRYLLYTTPQSEPILLMGIHTAFQQAQARAITIQLCDSSIPHIWTPFYQTTLQAAAGDATPGAADVFPVLPLPAPYLIQPGHRIQIVLRPDVAAILNTPDRITLAGLRDFRTAEEWGGLCYS